jgi:fibronectin type 3 domain-containing protein
MKETLHQRFASQLVFLLAALFFCSPLHASPPQEEKADIKPVITAAVSPAARLKLYTSVAILPILVDGKKTDDVLTNTLYQSLLELQKYQLLPLAISKTWFGRNFSPISPFSPGNIAHKAGIDLQANAVLVAEVQHRQHPGEIIIALQNNVPVTTYNFTLVDTVNKKTVWNLFISCQEGKTQPFSSPEKITAVFQQAINILRTEMVKKGDIFSSQLPQPEVLSSQGDIRSVRIVLQPDPPHIFSSYQLLRAEDEKAVFSAVGTPVANEAPVILADEGLKDATSYFYTVIGLTAEGFANIPAPPFKIDTTGPPAPVKNLRAGSGGLRHIQLFWDPSQDPTVDGYHIFRSRQADGSFVQIAEINGREKQTYIDKGQASGFSRYGTLEDNTHYFYTIRTRNIVGIESNDSPVIMATTKGAPDPPTDLQAIDRQPKKLPLAWTAATNPEITGYAIYRASSPEGPFQQIDYVNGREQQQYIDNGSWDHPLANNTTYWYRVRSVNVVNVHSADSTTVSATTKAAPKKVFAVQAQSGLFRQIILNWQPNPEPDIWAYEIYRGEVKNNISTRVSSINPELTTYTDNSLGDSRTYWYQIRAIDKDGLAGKRSEIIHATTKHPPVQPRGLTANISNKEIRISWKTNPEKDIDHYEISSGGFLAGLLGKPKEPFFQYRLEEEAGTELHFQVRAVDKDGLKSAYSEALTVIVPK